MDVIDTGLPKTFFAVFHVRFENIITPIVAADIDPHIVPAATTSSVQRQLDGIPGNGFQTYTAAESNIAAKFVLRCDPPVRMHDPLADDNHSDITVYRKIFLNVGNIGKRQIIFKF